MSISVASSSSVGSVGSSISFTAIPSLTSASISSVVWFFGDGTNQTVNGPTTNHTYTNGGSYLVLAQVTATVQNLIISNSVSADNSLALFPIVIQPTLTQAQAQNASVPTINFPATNPNAPLVSVGDSVNPIGGFLEAPSNANWTIQQYSWNFGNGNHQTVSASSTGDPAQNVSVTYTTSGLYPLSLMLTTNSTGAATFSVTIVHTIAVQSTTSPYGLLVSASHSLNPGVITSAEVAPGGPYSWDPQVDYDLVGEEELFNIYETLVFYQGSSTTTFIPYLAAAIPTQQNGGISSDYKTYVFQIRNDQYFSNGDPVTAYDVWFSFARGIAFANGSPGTADWIQDQYLIPGVQNGTASVYTNNTWSASSTAITYDNASNTVTFHFNRPMSPTLVFQILADPEGAAIVDAKYAWSVGAGFTQASWNDYMNQANSASYNIQMQWNPVGSGPYMIQSYTPGQSLEMAPNPHYDGVPEIPKISTSVVIDWVKTPDTALLMLQDGQADSVFGLPSSDFPSVQKLQSQGLAKIYNFPTITIDFINFNIAIDKTLEASQFGSAYNEPSNYFADLPTRFTFIDSFDYQGFLNNILGNSKYGTTFGTGYVGLPPPGVSPSFPSDELGGLPTQNLNAAKENFSISAFHDQKINLPIFVFTGWPTELAAALEWSSTLNQISGGNITATPVQVTNAEALGYAGPNINPMGVYFFWWNPDYPDPSDSFEGIFELGNYFPAANGFTVSNFASLPPSNQNNLVHLNGAEYTQAQVYAWINGNASLGDSSIDPVAKQSAYKTADILAIAMGLYVYTYESEFFWYWKPWLSGYQYQENPMVGAFGDLAYFWLVKS